MAGGNEDSSADDPNKKKAQDKIERDRLYQAGRYAETKEANAAKKRENAEEAAKKKMEKEQQKAEKRAQRDAEKLEKKKRREQDKEAKLSRKLAAESEAEKLRSHPDAMAEFITNPAERASKLHELDMGIVERVLRPLLPRESLVLPPPRDDKTEIEQNQEESNSE